MQGRVYRQSLPPTDWHFAKLPLGRAPRKWTLQPKGLAFTNGSLQGLYMFGTETYQSVLGGLALYGTARGALAAGQEVLAAGRDMGSPPLGNALQRNATPRHAHGGRDYIGCRWHVWDSQGAGSHGFRGLRGLQCCPRADGRGGAASRRAIE